LLLVSPGTLSAIPLSHYRAVLMLAFGYFPEKK